MNKGIMSGMAPVRLKDGGFPDLTGDGKVTQKDILRGRGIQGFAEGGEADSKTKLVGKDGLIFDYTSPTDYALLIPGLGLVGLGAKALTKGSKITDVINKAFKLAGKPGQKVLGKPTKTLSGPGVKGGQTVVPSGRSADALDDFLIGRGRDRILGSTRTGQATRLAGATYVGGKLIDSDGKEIEQDDIPQDLGLGDGSGKEAPDTRNFIERLKDLPSKTYERIQNDPDFRDRFLAGSMAMMQPTEGFVPTSGVTQFYEGFEDKKKEQKAEKLADLTLAAKLKAAQPSSIFDNILEGTKDFDKIAMLPTAVSETLYGGAEKLIATPQGAPYMRVEAGDPVDGSMMTSLIQQLQSDGYSGTNLQAALQALVQTAPE